MCHGNFFHFVVLLSPNKYYYYYYYAKVLWLYEHGDLETIPNPGVCVYICTFMCVCVCVWRKIINRSGTSCGAVDSGTDYYLCVWKYYYIRIIFSDNAELVGKWKSAEHQEMRDQREDGERRFHWMSDVWEKELENSFNLANLENVFFLLKLIHQPILPLIPYTSLHF